MPYELLLAAGFALILAGCDGNNMLDADSDAEDEIEGPDEIDLPDVDGEEEPADSVQDDVPADEDEEEEVVIGPGCGDGIVEAPESCDDGNRATEFCGRWNDCLGDCSLAQVKCGNGRVDPGEECDDGNADNLDNCTTSCNINDRGIGSPCDCPNCFGIAVTEEPIFGCEGVHVPPGTGGVLGCVPTVVEPYSGYEFFAPEGYCSICAMKCLGDEIDCQEVEEIGDVDNFECPPGYPYFGVSCTGTGGIGIVLKLCLRPCSSPSQCRWNSFDESQNECGRQDCIYMETAPSQGVCFDQRNFNMDLPDIECVYI